MIVPTRVGAVGANALNQSLQEALNPPSPEKAQFENNGRTFRVGDKVMQIKNNYDILWQKENGEEGWVSTTGDIGFIETIDRPSKTMQVRFDRPAGGVPVRDGSRAGACLRHHRSQESGQRV